MSPTHNPMGEVSNDICLIGSIPIYYFRPSFSFSFLVANQMCVVKL